ncbi:MAG: phytanoyl-CoA dioxygenase family protein [Candidatus Poribacteria bacterium]|nr:phytanoyl-CoA dioxygenase family protein [Candidatus Poribacteria bacterium]
MSTGTSQSKRQFAITPDELSSWEENGYFVRYDVFTKKENDVLRQIADDIVDGKRLFPTENINQNALVRDGKVEASGINAIHKIHHVSCYIPEFLARVRDARLTDPIVDLLGLNLLGLNNLYIWKAPKIGLGFPWHQDKWYFNHQYKTEMTVGTWTAIDAADKDNGCLYVIPGSHKYGILTHEDLEGSQQNEFKIARDAKDEDGVAVEVPPGAVVWFNNQLLHKSTDNHSLRFRRCNVAHYISGDAERVPKKNTKNMRPVMWVRGGTYSEKMEPVYQDVLPIPESN